MASPSKRALKSLSNLPATPGRQVVHLKAELEKKEKETDSLKNNVADLTKALEGLQLVKDKVAASENPFNKDESKSKKTKKKDANAPAPAVTAYRYFCEDMKVTMETEEKSGKDMRLMWKECQGDARKKYTEMAAVDKQRFEKENEPYQKVVAEKEMEDKALQMYYDKQKQDLAMEFYEAHMQVQNLADKKNKKKEKDPDAPKGAISSYLFFCQEKRESITKDNSEKSPTEITKILGEEWGKLVKGKRGKTGTKKYDDRAAKDRLRYEEEKQAYDAKKALLQSGVEQEREVQLQKDKEEALKLMKEVEEANKVQAMETEKPAEIQLAPEATAKAKKEPKPSGPKRPSSAYIFFTVGSRAQIKASMPETTTNQELMAEIGRQWKSLNENLKKVYEDMAMKDKARYEREMEAMKKI